MSQPQHIIITVVLHDDEIAALRSYAKHMTEFSRSITRTAPPHEWGLDDAIYAALIRGVDQIRSQLRDA